MAGQITRSHALHLFDPDFIHAVHQLVGGWVVGKDDEVLAVDLVRDEQVLSTGVDVNEDVGGLPVVQAKSKL